MKFPVKTLFVALVALASTMPQAAASEEQGEYTIGTTPGLSVVCSPDCLGTGLGLNIGGYTFAAKAAIPVSVRIADASGGPVAYTVCQDFDGRLCGNADPATGAVEPRVAGCGSVVNLASSPVAFRAGVPVSVFVRAVDAACPGSLALGGTITITYNP